jgi:hypothetical protein
MSTIKHATNEQTGEEYKVLISVTKFNAKQFAMIQAIIAFFDALVAFVTKHEAFADANMLKAYCKVRDIADASKITLDEETIKRYAQRIFRRSEI